MELYFRFSPFFLFFVIALDQGFEWLRHQAFCSDWPDNIRQGNDFVVCAAAKLPLSTSPQYMHEIYGFFTAILTFSIVFGAFAANVLYGAMRAVPKEQIDERISKFKRNMHMLHYDVMANLVKRTLQRQNNIYYLRFAVV